jgi:hypothetical protein
MYTLLLMCYLHSPLRGQAMTTRVAVGAGMTPSLALVMVCICEELFFSYEVVGRTHKAAECLANEDY